MRRLEGGRLLGTGKVLLLLVLIAALLLVQRIGVSVDGTVADTALLNADELARLSAQTSPADAPEARRALIVYDAADGVKENVEYVLETARVEVTAAAYDQCDGLELADYDDLVICVSDLGNLAWNADECESWVKDGGNILFLGVMTVNDAFYEYRRLLGMRGGKSADDVAAEGLEFAQGFLLGADEMSFGEDVYSGNALDFQLTGKCEVLVESAKGVALAWDFDMGDGRVAVCNMDALDEKSMRGILISLYARCESAFCYPVINAAMYCLDDFPSPVPAGYDEGILNQYGYTVGNFYSNVWWPGMLGISEKYGIKYTGFLIQTYEDETSAPFDNRDYAETAAFYASALINSGGELGVHGYNHQSLTGEDYALTGEESVYRHWPSDQSAVKSILAALDYAFDISNAAPIRPYAAPSNVIQPSFLSALIENAQELRVYAGVYVGTQEQMIQEYEAFDTGVVYVPRLTADMAMDDTDMWLLLSEVNFHYVSSHFIHPDDALDEDRGADMGFDGMLESFGEMVSRVNDLGLKPATVSEGALAVQRCQYLKLRQSIDENTLRIRLDGMSGEAYLMLRLNGKRIVSAYGASYKMLDGSAALLTATENDVVVILEDC